MRTTVRRLAGTLLIAAAAVLGVPAGASAATAHTTRASSAAELHLVLPLRADSAGLRRFANAVTDPSSPEYGRYESVSWLERHFGASRSTERRAIAYLRGAGATDVKVDNTGLLLEATVRAATAERLFGTELEQVHSTRAGNYVRPAAGTSLPSVLRGLVTGVVGLDTRQVAESPSTARPAPGSDDTFRSLTASVGEANAASDEHVDTDEGSAYTPVSGTPSGCPGGLGTGGFSPSQYLTAYGISALQAGGTQGQNERVALIEIDGFKQSDIKTFATCFGLKLPKIVAFRTGANVSAGGLAPGAESTLDLEVLAATAPKLQSIDVYESQSDAADVLEAMTAPLENPGYKPQVISASLGLCESQTEQAIGRSGVAAVESALETAAASGISVLAASGDNGSADCQDDNGNPIPQLAVNYPASSIWVTGVGGTNLTLNATNAIVSQSVWNDDAAAPGKSGGGGFSELFNAPSYQRGTVAGPRREVPDVALLADISPGYDVYCTATPDCLGGGFTDPWQPFGGTSAATPLLAGGFALVDQLLRQHKLQSLGLANPLLYELGRAATPNLFDDVTAGSDDVGPFIQASAQPLGCCTAAAGFDAASGWGGVNLATFAVEALAHQPALVDISMALPGDQRPLAAKAIKTNITCDGSCLAGAYVAVFFGSHREFTDYSSLVTLRRKGTRTVKISLTAKQRLKIAAAIAAGTKVTAVVVGAIVDPAGNIERSTPKRTLRVTR